MIEYTNPQMLSMEELHKIHLEMAKNYLETKWGGCYYELYSTPQDETPLPFEEEQDFDRHPSALEIDLNNLEFGNLLYIDGEYDSSLDLYDPDKCYTELTGEQFSRINQQIQKSGESPLYEALADESELLKLIIDKRKGCYASSIGDIPHQNCVFTVGVMDSSGQMSSFEYSALLTKEDYLKLLVIVMDNRDVTFNDLYFHDFELYKKISEIISPVVRSNSERENKLSYTLVFTEIENDVFVLLGEERYRIDLCNYNENYGCDRIAWAFVQFSEKRMAVWHNYIYPFEDVTEVLYNIDATTVLELLNVDSYHDASVVLKDRFYGIDAFYDIRTFLNNNKIKYESVNDSVELDEQGNPINE